MSANVSESERSAWHPDIVDVSSAEDHGIKWVCMFTVFKMPVGFEAEIGTGGRMGKVCGCLTDVDRSDLVSLCLFLLVWARVGNL